MSELIYSYSKISYDSHSSIKLEQDVADYLKNLSGSNNLDIKISQIFVTGTVAEVLSLDRDFRLLEGDCYTAIHSDYMVIINVDNSDPFNSISMR